MAKTNAQYLDEIETSSLYKVRCEGETWKVETRADGLLVKKGLELRDAVQLVKSLEYDMANLS
ncbi:hypothetical protein LCGC14_2922740 [marine sediment metagenome]|uniref:Uncharacterized protein n=1 Tax=marine sediment metagenome TaxID=412755 RepID=A0A0F8XNM1_9ZZZZ